MKTKTGKNLSWLLSLALAASLFGQTVSFAEETAKSGVVFNESFEDWDVGVLQDTAGEYTIKNLKFSLLENDKLEIAVNKYGNKALKITTGNTSTSAKNRIRYIFPEQYSGEVKVSFDFLSEHNSRCFSSFGALEYNTNPNIIHNFTHYQDHIYVGNIGVNILRDVISSTLSNGYVRFTETYNTLNNPSKTVSLGYDRWRKTGLEEEITQQSVNSPTLGTPEKIYGIRWEVYNGGGWNGNDKAVDSADTINAGVYWIDNITVETDVPVLSQNNKSVTENFDGYTKDVVYTGATFAKIGAASLKLATGDSAAVTTDPATNSKALRVIKGTNESPTYLDVNLGSTEQAVKLSFDVRFQNHSRYLRYFPQILDASGNGVVQSAVYRDDIYWNTVGQYGKFMANNMRSADNKDIYTSFEYIIDPVSGKAYSEIKSPSVDMRTKEYDISASSVKTMRFYFENAVSGGTNNSYTAHMGGDVDSDVNNPDNNGIYWIDNIKMEYPELSLDSSIANGETNVATGKSIDLVFNAAVADNAADSILITKNENKILELNTDYTVSISADAKTVTISPVNGWDYEANYSVLIGEIAAKLSSVAPYAGTEIRFATAPYTALLVDEHFENYTIGQKWEGPGNFVTGSITLRLCEGDSVEYANDPQTGLNGFKLTKGNANGNLDFVYSFPQTYENGKYMVKIDERVQNHSKGHKRWPSMLSGRVSGQIDRMILRAPSYWLTQVGSIGMDRYGVDHSSVSTSRYISASTKNARTVVFGELSTGAGYRYGLYDPLTNNYISSVEPATTETKLSGVLMEMASGGSENYSDGYQCGTQVDKDVENNPNNDGIAWIYGITVEKVTLSVESTSFDKDSASFSPEKEFTVTFNREVNAETVNTENIKLYENGKEISSYEYTVNIKNDGRTVVINPVSGIKYGTLYNIEISANVKAKDTQVGDLRNKKTYIIQTAEYEDTTAPDITWSTLPDGIKNVEPDAGNVILSTNNVYINADTITKQNIKMYENGTEFSDYTVGPYGLYAIKVSFDTLKKDSVYKIAVSGLLSGGAQSLAMTKSFETTFMTRADIYTTNLVSGISGNGTKSYVSAELFNKSGKDIGYLVIGALKDADGNILSVAQGSKGALTVGDTADIRVEMPKNAAAKYFDLYIWDGTETLKPLTKKSVLDAVNEKTYGYDNYSDSSKPLKVVYIGGSITQQRQYTTPLTQSLDGFFKKDNSQRTITYSVQGLGGTNSTLGLYRLEKDVAAQEPDIVFVEFAVNDTDSTSVNRTKSMEGIIRKLMKLKHQPMVVLLDMTTASYGSLDVVADWEPLMSAYGIGYINVGQYIKDNEASAENPAGFVWKEEDLGTYPQATALTAKDGVHPTATGGKAYADYMAGLLTETPQNYFKKMTYTETPVSGYEYNNPRMTAWSGAEYDDKWEKTNDMSWTFYKGAVKAKSAGASLTYKFTGTTIGLFVPKSATGTTADYSIDNGAYTGTVSCYGNVSTDMPMMSLIKTDLPEGEHTITITVNEAQEVNFRFGYFIVD